MPCEPDVLIRPYTVEDAAVVFEAVRESMAELMPWMPWCRPEYSLQDSQSWLATQAENFRMKKAFEFAIVSSGGRFFGGCGLNRIDEGDCCANLGYWVRSTAAHRGVATAAVALLRKWAFEQTDLIRLEILVATGNPRSQRVAEKAGAVREGVLRSRLLLQGTPHDAVVFSFVKTDKI